MRNFVRFILPIISLFIISSCEINPGGRYVEQYQLTGFPWVETWIDGAGNKHEHQIYFYQQGHGRETFLVNSAVTDAYQFTWEWWDEQTLYLYYDRDNLFFDIYELTAFRLYGRLGNETVDFSN